MPRNPGQTGFLLLIGCIVASMVLGVIALALGHPTLGWWISNGGTLVTLLGFGSWVYIKTRPRSR